MRYPDDRPRTSLFTSMDLFWYADDLPLSRSRKGVNAFSSLTMYELPSLVANSLNRHLVNSPMLPQFKKDADGGLTLIVQNEFPGKDKEPTGCPRQRGPFFMAMPFTDRSKKP